jgi:hypothetical protein
MTRLVFVRHQRFQERRRRAFTVAVWRIVKGARAPTVALWGRELTDAWKAVEAAE